MNTPRNIRKATQKDVSKLVDFQCLMAVETENVNLDIATATQGATQLVNDPTKGMYWVAEENGEIIGCLMTTSEWSDWRNGSVLWIQSVYIDEGHRRKGVYREMYEFIKAQVERDPLLKGIRLYVDTNNTKAQQVYQMLGMNGEHYQVYEWMKEPLHLPNATN